MPNQQKDLNIVRALRQALDDGDQFVLHYQPQVSMSTNEVVGAEALLRWRLDERLINPAEFIPIAERAGLIGEIGEWVLNEACAQIRAWDRRNWLTDPEFKVTVNLSVRQFSAQLPAAIGRAIRGAGVEAWRLGLEITESFIASDDWIDLLTVIHGDGHSLSLDDFGTGYSCLSRLAKLPVNVIKIDRSFVTELGQSSRGDALVESIVSLSAKLGMQTIAEGVETRAQASCLMESGCGVAQGFLYSRPLSAADFAAFAWARVNQDTQGLVSPSR